MAHQKLDHLLKVLNLSGNPVDLALRIGEDEIAILPEPLQLSFERSAQGAITDTTLPHAGERLEVGAQAGIGIDRAHQSISLDDRSAREKFLVLQRPHGQHEEIDQGTQFVLHEREFVLDRPALFRSDVLVGHEPRSAKPRHRQPTAEAGQKSRHVFPMSFVFEKAVSLRVANFADKLTRQQECDGLLKHH